MTSKWFFFSAASLSAVVAVAVTRDVDNSLLKSHTDALQKAPSISITFTVNRLGSEIQDEKLVISKPGLVRWETPAKIVIANGTTISEVDRKSNSYTETDQTPESLKAVFGDDVIWAWSALVDAQFTKPITDAKTGASRNVKGAAVKELTTARKDRLVTLYIDNKLGFARGVTFESESGGQKVTNVVLASEIEVGKEPLMANSTAFTLPAGAKKMEKAAGLTFASVRPILQASCGCHMGGPKGGLSLSSYANVMKGGRSGPAVNPGNADESILIQVITGQRAPKMPPNGAVPTDKLATLKQWINDGAKE